MPADFGEVVDLAAYTSISPESDTKYFSFKPVAILGDGTCSAMNWHPEVESVRDQLTDVVAIDIGRFSFMALRGDGTAVAVGMHFHAMKKENLDFDDVAEWKDLARISAGDMLVGGVTASGKAKLAGDNRWKQREIPEDLQSDILDVDVKNTSGDSALLQKGRDDFRFVKFGQHSNLIEFEKDERFFVNFNAMVADNRGRPTRESIHPNAANRLEKLGRTSLRDVIQMVRAETGTFPTTMGVTAVCEENDRWTFWGNTEEVGGFDPAYCSERAAGAWKLFPMYPYVLALKPVSKLTPDDWTGAAPAPPTR